MSEVNDVVILGRLGLRMMLGKLVFLINLGKLSSQYLIVSGLFLSAGLFVKS